MIYIDSPHIILSEEISTNRLCIEWKLVWFSYDIESMCETKVSTTFHLRLGYCFDLNEVDIFMSVRKHVSICETFILDTVE